MYIEPELQTDALEEMNTFFLFFPLISPVYLMIRTRLLKLPYLRKYLVLLKGYSLAKLQDQMDSAVSSTKSSIIY